MYRLFFSVVLRRIPPERAHALARASLRLVRSTRLGRALVRCLVGRTPGCLTTRALGQTFPSPLGAAAGLDKDGTWFQELGALGFGFVEVGTITARAQPGNPPPRVARLMDDRAIVNRMGFPNPGADVAAANLAHRAAGPVVGANVGKSMAVPLEEAAADYRAAVRRLAPVADYLVLNVSSPNTPGLRDMQAPDRLRSLIAAVRAELSAIACARPLLIKIGPDTGNDVLDALTALAREVELDGIVAVNTTVNYTGLRDGSSAITLLGGGGLSGAPLRARAVEVLRRIRRTGGEGLVLISVGGVETAEDVWQRLRAGATLVQAYTALVYEGPAWPKRINRELARRVRDAGLGSVQDLVGLDVRDTRPAAEFEAP